MTVILGIDLDTSPPTRAAVAKLTLFDWATLTKLFPQRLRHRENFTSYKALKTPDSWQIAGNWPIPTQAYHCWEYAIVARIIPQVWKF
jgi:hypothetical protein